MENLWGLDLDALLAMAAILLGLSIAAQVLQEIYKYVTASKARMYKMALGDFIGQDRVEKLYDERPDAEPDKAADIESLFLRGPFQFGWKDKKKARLLPLEKENLLNALEDTAPAWNRKAIEVLKKEAELQQGAPAKPSPILLGLIAEAWKGYWAEETGPSETFDFLERWGAVSKPVPPALEPKPADTVDASRLLEGYYQEFLRERDRVETRFEQFNANFEHAYSRRNLRQTLLLALVLAVGLNLPFTELYRQAKGLTPEEAAALADSLAELYEKSRPAATPDTAAAAGAAVSEPVADPVEAGAAVPAVPAEQEAAGGDAGDVSGDATAGGAGGETGDPAAAADPRLAELITELREPLEKILELDRKREEKALTALMKELSAPLAEFAAVEPADRQQELDSLMTELNEPLAKFLESPWLTEEDRQEDLERLLTELREPIAELVDEGEALDEARLAELQGELRGRVASFLDDKAGRRKLFSRGKDQLLALWQEDRSAIPAFLANCLITALLISFGAPFWHRASQALAGVARPARGRGETPENG